MPLNSIKTNKTTWNFKSIEDLQMLHIEESFLLALFYSYSIMILKMEFYQKYCLNPNNSSTVAYLYFVWKLWHFLELDLCNARIIYLHTSLIEENHTRYIHDTLGNCVILYKIFSTSPLSAISEPALQTIKKSFTLPR